MNGKAKQKAYIKWIVFSLVLALSLVWLAGCGTDNDASKDAGTNGTKTEDQKNPEDTVTTAGQDDGTDGTSTDGKGGDNPDTTTTGTGTDSTGTSGEPTGGTTTPTNTCTIQINCSLLVGLDLNGTGLESLVPSNGVILGTTKVNLAPGDTVYDVTLRVTKAQKIHMSSQGALGTIYIEAFANIYEKSYNSRSGWVYLINGAKPGVGCDAKELQAGDKVVWAYSLDNGNDL